MEKGLLIVVSGPSGAGKSITCKRVLEKRPEIELSVSCTTRAPREGEVDGENYFFLSEEEFVSRIENQQFLEHAEYLGKRYGTPKDYVLDMIDRGKDVILEIEVQGALMVDECCPEAVLVFVLPPSLQELEERLNMRGTETQEQTQKRLEKAKTELELINRYDYVIKNDEIDHAADQIIDIISAEKCAVKRNLNLARRLKEGETII